MADVGLEARFQQLCEDTGAIQTGHFQLASGLHSSRFFRCIKLFQSPTEMSFLFDALAERVSTDRDDINYVLGANEAGSILAFEVAKRLQAKVAIAKRFQGKLARQANHDSNHRYCLIDGFSFQSQARVLIVDDITTTGGTAKQLIEIVRGATAEPVGVGLIATKGLFDVDLSCPVEVLMTLKGMDAISPADCPLCQQGLPLTAS